MHLCRCWTFNWCANFICFHLLLFVQSFYFHKIKCYFNSNEFHRKTTTIIRKYFVLKRAFDFLLEQKKKLIGVQTKWMSAESDQNFWYNISFCSLIFVYQQFAVFVSNSSRKIHIFSKSTFAAFILKWSTFDLEIEKNYTELKVSLYVCHMSNEYVCATVRKGKKVIAG